MKRFLTGVIILFLLLGSAFTASATNVPEDLLHSDNAQIFFAEVIDYRPIAKTPDVPYVLLRPVKVIKGDVSLEYGWELPYHCPDPMGDFRVKKGKVYLIATSSHGDRYTAMYRATSYDTATLDLIDIEDGMGGIERFEHYLTEGEYEKAEAERQKRLGLEPQMVQIEGELPPLHTQKDDYIDIGIVGGVVTAIALAVLVVCVVKNKRKAQTNIETDRI